MNLSYWHQFFVQILMVDSSSQCNCGQIVD